MWLQFAAFRKLSYFLSSLCMQVFLVHARMAEKLHDGTDRPRHAVEMCKQGASASVADQYVYPCSVAVAMVACMPACLSAKSPHQLPACMQLSAQMHLTHLYCM